MGEEGQRIIRFVPAWVQNQEARQIEINMSALLEIERCWWKWLKYIAAIRFVTWMSVKRAHPLVTCGTTDFPLQQHSFYHSACWMTQSWQRAYVLSSGLIPKGKEAELSVLSSSFQTYQSQNLLFFLWGGVREWTKRGWKYYSMIIVHPYRNINSGKRRFFLQHNLSFLYSFL